jgi:hypothetical protein
MATTIYESATVTLIDGTELYITPLKLKYLREFMTAFDEVKASKDDETAIDRLVECIRISMKQFYPVLKTIDDVEDSFDLKTIYKILEVSAGIKMADKDEEEEKEKPVAEQAAESKNSWEDFDLAKIESEAFLLGIWKDYEDLETSMSMPELVATIEAKRELDYNEKKFLAGIQGIDLDKQSGKQDAWEEKKAKFFSGGQATDSSDILSMQGVNAQKSGFGIGMGLEYEKLN